jgi:hypothetical protein
MTKIFIVERQERWNQLVQVEADTEQEALDKAYDGNCTMHVDPEFVEFIHKENAAVTEVPPAEDIYKVKKGD